MTPRSQPAGAGPEVIFALDSILTPIDLYRLFTRDAPLELELGSGDGSFLAEYARAHPERNFLGIERLLGRLRKIGKKARRANLTNVRAIRIESSYFLEFLLPARSLTALHLYFPDPWPKRRHRHHRLVNDRFPILVRRVLVEQGSVFLRTDDRDYFEQMLDVFGRSHEFHAFETPAELKQFTTDFERDFNQRGIATNYAAYSFSS